LQTGEETLVLKETLVTAVVVEIGFAGEEILLAPRLQRL
jgi:hypothetical protein